MRPLALLLLALVGCAPPDAADLPDAAGADLVAAETLRISFGPAWMGYVVDAVVTGAPPGTSVGLASSDRPPSPGATCPRASKSCLDLVAPKLYGMATADGSGVARFRVALPFDDAAPLWFQAVVLRPDGPASSPATELLPDPYRIDSDGDRVLDPNEAMLGLDPFDTDTDNDGIPDGKDLAPLDPSRGRAEAFARDDLVVSTEDAFLVDPEWEVDSGRLVWATRDGGQLWLARVDLGDGALIPPDGRGTLLDTNTAPLDIAENGPEWAESAAGTDVIYAVPDDRVGWRLAHAWEEADGWHTGVLPGSSRGFGPLGQHDRSAPVSRISYWRNDRGYSFPRHGFGTIEEGGLGVLPTELTRADDRYTTGLGPVMSLTARNAAGTFDAYQQIALADTSAETVTWATDDPTWKYDATVWVDPRTGDPVAVVGRGAWAIGRYTEVAVYRRIGGTWTLQKVIPTPPSHPFVIQPRMLVWHGRSYVHFTASQGADAHDRQPGQIWIASIDADSSLLHRIDGTNGYAKLDSEAMTAGARPWVYYTEARPGQRVLRRCELGLP